MFKNSLEPACPVNGLVGLQGIGIYFQKESELLKKVQMTKLPEQTVEVNNISPLLKQRQ